MGFSDKAGLDHNNARTKEQKKLMEQIEADGVCPFCEEHFRKYHPKPIIKETDTWFFTENMSPYEGTTKHFIFVYKPAHVISPTEITQESRSELFELIEWAITKYNITGGSFFMRFGEGDWNGSSVEHLHAQLLVGIERTADTEGIRVKLGYREVG